MLLTSLVLIKLQATGNKGRDVLPFAVHQIVSPLWKTEVDQVHILQSAETVQYHHQQTIQKPHDPKALHPLTKHSYACYKLNGVANSYLIVIRLTTWQAPCKYAFSCLGWGRKWQSHKIPSLPLVPQITRAPKRKARNYCLSAKIQKEASYTWQEKFPSNHRQI